MASPEVHFMFGICELTEVEVDLVAPTHPSDSHRGTSRCMSHNSFPASLPEQMAESSPATSARKNLRKSSKSCQSTKKGLFFVR